MRTKIIKEYSNRQRINLTNEDNFITGEQVYIFTEEEHHQQEEYISQLQLKLTTVQNECEVYKNRAETFEEVIKESKTQTVQLEEIIKETLSPIEEHYKKEIKKKEDIISELNAKIEKIQVAFHQFNTRINQLSTLDIWLRKKHHQVINEFTNSVWIISKEDNIIDTEDVPAIPEADNVSQES